MSIRCTRDLCPLSTSPVQTSPSNARKEEIRLQTAPAQRSPRFDIHRNPYVDTSSVYLQFRFIHGDGFPSFRSTLFNTGDILRYQFRIETWKPLRRVWFFSRKGQIHPAKDTTLLVGFLFRRKIFKPEIHWYN